MARVLKEMLIAGYGKDLAGSNNLIVVDPGNMTVERTREFRRDLREKAGGAKVRVIHNRTARRAFGALWSGREKALDEVLAGPSAVATARSRSSSGTSTRTSRSAPAVTPASAPVPSSA